MRIGNMTGLEAVGVAVFAFGVQLLLSSKFVPIGNFLGFVMICAVIVICIINDI